MQKIKPNWKKYIHVLRRKELNIVFSHPLLKSRRFETVLEMGAGDGFQSKILKKFTDKLYCTDLNDKRLIQENKEINYVICDAEIIDEYFPEGYFDFVFSSNLFEHLLNPGKALNGIYKILKDDGISVHVMPSPFSAIMRIVLWYPAILIGVLDKLLRGQKLNIRGRNKGEKDNLAYIDNNLKIRRSYESNLRRVLFPRPHGVSESVFREIFAWRSNRWRKEIENNGFKIIDILKGPVSSGYGFGLDFMRSILEELGFTSEHIYIFKKIIPRDTSNVYRSGQS